MAIAVLKEITSAEEQAEQMEVQARQNAHDIIAAAKRDVAVLFEKTVEQAELEAAEMVRLAEEKAAKDIVDMKMKIQAQCQDIRENAGKKMNEAVDFIVGRIVKQ